MKSSEIRSRFLKFFQKREHAIIESASLVTTDEKGTTNATLFNTAGMQPLIPFLLGKIHPHGTRLVDSQKCLRTVDIDDIGDKTHATFFEMLGNWSLGDYFKKEAIKWSYEFLTSKDEGLGLDPNRLYVTVFKGDENAKKDEESRDIWKSVGVPEHRIYFKDAASNWWPAVKKDDTWTGPTGPCSEMFYDITEEGLGDLSPLEFEKNDNEQKVVEIWNDVFMEFEKKEGKIVGKLEKKNVDTGAGLERLCAVLQKVDNIFDTDLLSSLMEISNTLSTNISSQRIISDHMRSATFLISDGVIPSNTDRGYILRRLIRRAIFNTKDKRLDNETIKNFVNTIVEKYKDTYKNLLENKNKIEEELIKESEKFKKTLLNGLKEFEKIVGNNSSKEITALEAITLSISHGFPIDMILDLAKERDMKVDIKGFEEEFKKHQELSRKGAEKKFKGGLADENDEMVLRYHTATHLLHQALTHVLGKNVQQKGSNITRERLRFDFSHETKMTEEEKKKVEEIINRKIKEKLPVNKIIMPIKEAEKTGAKHFFGEKYGDEVSIYFVGKDMESAYSKEFCGGPHVGNTSDLEGPEGKWVFKIKKEEAVAQGIRRIKAVLE